MLAARINYIKTRGHFRFLPVQSGGYVAALKYNPFLERPEKAGFKLKNLDTRRLMENRRGIGLLLLLRRLGKETYRRLSHGSEVQYNFFAAERMFDTGPVTESAVVYVRSGRYQAYVGRITLMRHLVSPLLRLDLNGGSYRLSFRPFAAYNWNRLEFFAL